MSHQCAHIIDFRSGRRCKKKTKDKFCWQHVNINTETRNECVIEARQKENVPPQSYADQHTTTETRPIAVKAGRVFQKAFLNTLVIGGLLIMLSECFAPWVVSITNFCPDIHLPHSNANSTHIVTYASMITFPPQDCWHLNYQQREHAIQLWRDVNDTLNNKLQLMYNKLSRSWVEFNNNICRLMRFTIPNTAIDAIEHKSSAKLMDILKEQTKHKCQMEFETRSLVQIKREVHSIAHLQYEQYPNAESFQSIQNEFVNMYLREAESTYKQLAATREAWSAFLDRLGFDTYRLPGIYHALRLCSVPWAATIVLSTLKIVQLIY